MNSSRKSLRSRQLRKSSGAKSVISLVGTSEKVLGATLLALIAGYAGHLAFDLSRDEPNRSAPSVEAESDDQVRNDPSEAAKTLATFFGWAAGAMKSTPGRQPSADHCSTEGDPDFGWCFENAGPLGARTIQWHRDEPTAFKISSESLEGAAPFGCLTHMKEVRSWNWSTNKMVHCSYDNGSGVQQLVKNTDAGTVFVWIFSEAYLARDPSFRENLLHQGDPRFEASDAIARRVALGQVASKMGETTNPPHTTGPDSAILIPSDDPAKCLLWGSMWTGSGDNNVASDLASLGFRRIECGGKAWEL